MRIRRVRPGALARRGLLVALGALSFVPPVLAQAESDPLAGARSRGSLTLDDCFTAALSRNERTARASEDVRQAELDRKVRIAAVLPQVTLGDDYFRQNQVTLNVPTGSTSTAFSFEDSRNQVFLRLNQPIFSGLRERNALIASDHTIEAARHRAEDERRLLYGDVALAFYAVLQKEGEVETLEDTVTVERERVREIRARFEAGLARKTEVLLTESQLAGDESLLTRARNDLQVARDRLAFVIVAPADLPLQDTLGEPEALVIAPGGEAGSGAADPVEPLVRTALENRSDVRELRAAVEAARSLVRVMRGEAAPTLSLEGNAYLDRQHYSTFQQETDWTVEINFTFPLFDGGRTRANVAAARSRQQQAELDHQELTRRIAIEVRNAWLTLASDAAQLETLAKSVASASENDLLIREEYRSGLATNLEVFAAQNQLLSARLDLERQKYLVKLDWVNLHLTQGLTPLTNATSGTP